MTAFEDIDTLGQSLGMTCLQKPNGTNMKTYWVYMMLSDNGRALYTGVTNNLDRRVREHKEGIGSVFTAKYKCHKLVYYEEFETKQEAMSREWHIKQLTRKQKEELVFNSQVSNNNEMIKM